ncbi:hypothetical protein [Luteococcus sp. OSA5]|uniref:hypothetical protein n=1 Tax=Luteococcus sp. OSA5 TaxID=3401630 RepID=UPI003B43720C
MSIHRRLALGTLVALTVLSGCGSDQDPPTPGQNSPAQSSSSTSAASEPASTPTVTGTPGATGAAAPAGTKKFTTAKLPTTVGDYSGSDGMYTGASEDQMLMMTLSPGLDFNKVTAGLDERRTTGRATCGRDDGVANCFAALDGGVLWLQGTDRTQITELVQVTNLVYDGFA